MTYHFILLFPSLVRRLFGRIEVRLISIDVGLKKEVKRAREKRKIGQSEEKIKDREEYKQGRELEKNIAGSPIFSINQ